MKAESVLFVQHADGVGGAELSLLSLIAEFAKGGISVAVAGPLGSALRAHVSLSAVPWYDIDWPRAGVINVSALAPKNGIRYLHSQYNLYRLFDRLRPDWIYANGEKAALLACIPCKSRGRPLVWHVRDYPRRPAVSRFLVRMSLLQLASSAFIASRLIQIAPDAQRSVHLVGNPVEPCNVGPGAGLAWREREGYQPDSSIVTMVAHFAPWKRHDVFLDALSEIRRNPVWRHVQGIVAGTALWPKDQACLDRIREHAATLGLDGAIRFLGQRQDVPDLLAASNVLVLPSDAEPFGRVVVEAWWNGTPVVASESGGPAELIQDGVQGLLVAPGDAHELAEAITRVLSDSALAQSLAAKGRYAAEAYLPERHATRVREALESCRS